MIISKFAVIPAEYRLHVSQMLVEYREFGIMGGYRRPNCTLWQAVASVFWPTNETVNFWTHFVSMAGRFVKDDVSLWDPYHWPFLVFLTITCVWPLVSCLAHLLNVISVRLRYGAFFCDYMVISLYSFGSPMVYNAYSMDNASLLFLIVSAFSALLVTLISCQSPFVEDNVCVQKMTRIAGFVVGYSVSHWALAVRLLRHWLAPTVSVDGKSEPDPSEVLSMAYHARQIVFTILGASIYTLHRPEVWWPGQFAIIGNSHQIMHVLVVLASHYQIKACYGDMVNRRNVLSVRDNLAIGKWSAWLATVVLLANLIIVTMYMRRVYVKLKKKCK